MTLFSRLLQNTNALAGIGSFIIALVVLQAATPVQPISNTFNYVTQVFEGDEVSTPVLVTRAEVRSLVEEHLDEDDWRNAMLIADCELPLPNDPYSSESVGAAGELGQYQINPVPGTVRYLREQGIIERADDLRDPATNVRAARALLDAPWNENKPRWYDWRYPGCAGKTGIIPPRQP